MFLVSATQMYTYLKNNLNISGLDSTAPTTKQMKTATKNKGSSTSSGSIIDLDYEQKI